jgi:hypothetical protein
MNQQIGTAQGTRSSAPETAAGHQAESAHNDRVLHRMNQVLSGVVACAVLGVGGLIAYQNRDAIKTPSAKDGPFGSLLKKKFAAATAFPQNNLPEFKAPDWEKNSFVDPSAFAIQGFQYNPAQSLNTTSSSSSPRRRP